MIRMKEEQRKEEGKRPDYAYVLLDNEVQQNDLLEIFAYDK